MDEGLFEGLVITIAAVVTAALVVWLIILEWRNRAID
jgi:hypothetical protein